MKITCGWKIFQGGRRLEIQPRRRWTESGKFHSSQQPSILLRQDEQDFDLGFLWCWPRRAIRILSILLILSNHMEEHELTEQIIGCVLQRLRAYGAKTEMPHPACNQSFIC